MKYGCLVAGIRYVLEQMSILLSPDDKKRFHQIVSTNRGLPDDTLSQHIADPDYCVLKTCSDFPTDAVDDQEFTSKVKIITKIWASSFEPYDRPIGLTNSPGKLDGIFDSHWV